MFTLIEGIVRHLLFDAIAIGAVLGTLCCIGNADYHRAKAGKHNDK